MWLNEQTAFYCMQPDRLRLHLNVVCSFHDTHTKKAPPPSFFFKFLTGMKYVHATIFVQTCLLFEQ